MLYNQTSTSLACKNSLMNCLIDLILYITLNGIIIIIDLVLQISLVIFRTNGNHKIK